MRLIIPALLCLILVSSLVFGANEAPYNSGTISGLGARNIGSATMSGRISAVGTNRPNCCESEKQRHCFCQCAGSALERLGRSRALSHNRWRQKLGARAQGK